MYQNKIIGHKHWQSSKMKCTINYSVYWLRAPAVQLQSMSLMRKVWHSVKISGLHSSSLCVEHDEASATRQHYTCSICVLFSCCNKHTLAGWARADRGGPVCQWISSRTMHWDAAKPVRHPRDSRWGPLARNALSIMWQMARSLFLFSFLCEPVARLAECNNPSNKCKDRPQTFVWTNGRICWCSGEWSTLPIVLF